MLDIAEKLNRWIEEARSFAATTVVPASGSGPGEPRATLTVDAEGAVTGSLSGGCVDRAVHELCHKVMLSGGPAVARLDRSDADAAGPACGGAVDLLVTPVLAGTPVGAVLRSALPATARGEPAALARVVRGPADTLGAALLVRPDGSHEGGLGGPPKLDQAAAAEAHALLKAGRSTTPNPSASAARWGPPGKSPGKTRSARAVSPCSSSPPCHPRA